MNGNFEPALGFTLRYEGGWSDHPRDPGGATMKGVTIGVYRAFKGRPVTKTELRNISDDDLKAIYRKGYWRAVNADALPAGYDAAMFDFAVNSGPARALRYDKLVKASNPRARIKELCAKRASFFRSLSTFDVFGRGWMSRVTALEAFALKLAGAGPVELKTEAKKAEAKATTNTAAATASGTGATITGATAANTAPSTPVEHAVALPTWSLIAIGVSLIAVAGAFAWMAWRDSKRADALHSEAGL